MRVCLQLLQHRRNIEETSRGYLSWENNDRLSDGGEKATWMFDGIIVFQACWLRGDIYSASVDPCDKTFSHNVSVSDIVGKCFVTWIHPRLYIWGSNISEVRDWPHHKSHNIKCNYHFPSDSSYKLHLDTTPVAAKRRWKNRDSHRSVISYVVLQHSSWKKTDH